MAMTYEERTRAAEEKAARMRARVNLRAALELLIPCAKAVARNPDRVGARRDYDQASLAFMDALDAFETPGEEGDA